MDITELLAFSHKQGASDLHLSAGLPPMIRVDGEVRRINLPDVDHKQVHALIYEIMNDKQRKQYEEVLETDFSFEIPGVARFRVNAFNQHRGAAAVFRWNGTSWSAASPTAATLNSISMIISNSTDIGWTVGTSSTALYFDGSSWTLKNTGLPASLTLKSVVTLSPNEAWLTDTNSEVYEWNGSTWTLVFTTTKRLNGIDILRPHSQPFSAWTENF